MEGLAFCLRFCWRPLWVTSTLNCGQRRHLKQAATSCSYAWKDIIMAQYSIESSETSLHKVETLLVLGLEESRSTESHSRWEICRYFFGKSTVIWLIEAWTKWLTFCRSHFERYFLERKVLIHCTNFTEVYLQCSNLHYVSFHPGNGLALSSNKPCMNQCSWCEKLVLQASCCMLLKGTWIWQMGTC